MQTDRHEFDVVIVGGGCAGSAAAITLAMHAHWRVAIVEASSYEHPRIGETTSAALAPLLKYLGLPWDLDEQGHIPAYDTKAAWGASHITSYHFLFTGRGHSWHLDRRRFDEALARRARGAGVTLLPCETVRFVSRYDQVWHVRARQRTLRARYLIDASGRTSSLMHHLGARRVWLDRLVGVGARFAIPDASGDSGVLIEAAEFGWWYSAPVPRGEMVAVLMSDADLIGRLSREESAWDAALSRSLHTASRIGDARGRTHLRTWAANTSFLNPPLGDGWVSAGDAAAAFDPLSSLGIGYALASGIQAARIADEYLRGEVGIAKTYPLDLDRHRETYLDQRSAIYGLEKRFPTSCFWSRRSPSRRASA